MNTNKRKGEASLVWIGAYKLAHGLLLAVVATGLLTLIHRDLQEVVSHWVHVWHLDADNHYVAKLLQEAGVVNAKTLEHLSAFTFAYGAVFITEGVGLMMKKRWAEYLTLVVTMSFVPLEAYEIHKHLTAIKVALLVVNLAIGAYILVMLRRKPAESS